MSIKTNPVQESNFVRIYLKTGDAVEAVIRTGLLYGTVDPRDIADEMLASQRVQELIASMQPQPSKKASEITRESIISDFERIHGEAMVEKDFGAAIAAKKNQATLMGLVQENVQVTHKMDVTRMTDEQIEKILEKRLKQNELKMIDVTPTPIGLGSVSVGK